MDLPFYIPQPAALFADPNFTSSILNRADVRAENFCVLTLVSSSYGIHRYFLTEKAGNHWMELRPTTVFLSRSRYGFRGTENCHTPCSRIREAYS
jgi:hypothetical protein